MAVDAEVRLTVKLGIQPEEAFACRVATQAPPACLGIGLTCIPADELCRIHVETLHHILQAPGSLLYEPAEWTFHGRSPENWPLTDRYACDPEHLSPVAGAALDEHQLNVVIIANAVAP